MGKVAVVVVHGIGFGTGEERCAFSVNEFITDER